MAFVEGHYQRQDAHQLKDSPQQQAITEEALKEGGFGNLWRWQIQVRRRHGHSGDVLLLRDQTHLREAANIQIKKQSNIYLHSNIKLIVSVIEDCD